MSTFKIAAVVATSLSAVLADQGVEQATTVEEQKEEGPIRRMKSPASLIRKLAQGSNGPKLENGKADKGRRQQMSREDREKWKALGPRGRRAALKKKRRERKKNNNGGNDDGK